MDLYVFPTKGYNSFHESDTSNMGAKLATKIKIVIGLLTDWNVGFG